MNIISRIAILLIVGCVSQAFASPPMPEVDESFEQFVERWNGWVDSVPEDQRAGDALIKAIDEIEADDFPNEKLWEERGYYKGDVLGYAYPWNEFWQYAPRIFDLYETQLNQVYEIASRPNLAIKIVIYEDPDNTPEDQIFEYSSYHSPLRSAAVFMTGHASYLAFNGQVDQAYSRLLAVADLRERCSELPTTLGWLTEGAIVDRFHSSIIEMLEYDPDLFEDHHLAGFQSRIVEQLESDFSSQFIFEQWITQETWRHLFQNQENGLTDKELRSNFEYGPSFIESIFNQFVVPFRNLPNSPSTYVPTPLAPLEEQIDLFQTLNAALIDDIHEGPTILLSLRFTHMIEEHLSGDNAERFLPVAQEVKPLWRMLIGIKHFRDYEARNNLIILGIYRHRLQTGSWPESLDDINPELLPYSTTDLYSGEPLGYRLSYTGPSLWALGANRYNNRGWPVEITEGEWGQERKWFSLDEWNALSEEDQAKHDGDWILMRPTGP